MKHREILLGVNVDHVATIRQARVSDYPCPVAAALIAEKAGADGITAHLREDRRHIQDHDIVRLKNECQTRLNFEMAITEEMLGFAEKIKPATCCLVPEKRQELTTEGGLDVARHFSKVQAACIRLAEAGILVSLFIDPDEQQVQAAKQTGAPMIEIHTGEYAQTSNDATLKRIEQAALMADQAGLIVNAGHGLTRENVSPIAAIPVINELNIGHAVIADAIFFGIAAAVISMKKIMMEARL